MSPDKGKNWPFRGFCLSVPRQKDIELFKRLVSEVLPKYNCNTVVLLIRYAYQFKSHPEVGFSDSLSAAQAADIASVCKQNNIRIIPKMNLLGHQSGRGKGTELGLLRSHPEFDETPDLPEVRYCRSLCPRYPKIGDMIFDLGSELIDAFGADAIHLGLDEVFEIGKCPRCKDFSNSQLFTDWVNELYDNFAGKKKAEVLMWSDRLLDGKTTGYGEWEASMNDTWTMIDNIPKDIIMCDWHYGKRDSYPSVPYFSGKGFRLVVCPWRDLEATKALLNYISDNPTEKCLGFLQTSWCDSGAVARYLCDNDSQVDEIPRQVGESFKWAMTF